MEYLACDPSVSGLFKKDRFLFLALWVAVRICLVAASWGSSLVGGTRASHCGDLSFLGPRALGRAGLC